MQAGLFSAILTAFLVESYTLLQSDPQQSSADLLLSATSILQTIALNQISNGNYTIPPAAPENSDEQFVPSAGALWINGMWFISLAISLGTAMAAMYIKQWLQYYQLHLSTGTADDYVHRRQYRYNYLLVWRVPGIISALPLCMNLSVVLFLLGLVVFLWEISQTIAIAFLAFIAALLLIYLATLILPLVVSTCPYRTSLSVTLEQTLHYIAKSCWRLFFEAALFLNNELQKKKRWSITLRLQSQYQATYSLLPGNAEIAQIKSRILDLELDSLIWILNNAQEQEAVDNVLQFIPQIEHVPDMVEKLLDNDVLVRLADKATVKLPSETDDFWLTVENLEPEDHVFYEMQQATKYMKSLISVWQHTNYFDIHHPPALFHKETSVVHGWLFGGWMTLWRRLQQVSGNESTDLSSMLRHGWVLDGFATLICAEVYYYYLQLNFNVANVTDGFLLMHSINDLDPLPDLLKMLNTVAVKIQPSRYTSTRTLKVHTTCLMLDTLAHVLARIPAEKELLFRSEILTILFSIFRSRKEAWDDVSKKILLCLELLTEHNIDNRKNILTSKKSHNSRDDFYAATCDVLSVFLVDYHKYSTDINKDANMKMAVSRLFNSALYQTEPSWKYNKYFMELPSMYAQSLLLEIAASPLPKFMKSAEWIINLLREWISSKQLSSQGLNAAMSILENILMEERQEDDFKILAEKILSFFCDLIRVKEDMNATTANLVCRIFANLFATSMSEDTKSNLLYKTIVEMRVINVVCSFFRTPYRKEEAVEAWNIIIPIWKERLASQKDLVVVEKHLWRYLCRAVGVFPI